MMNVCVQEKRGGFFVQTSQRFIIIMITVSVHCTLTVFFFKFVDIGVLNTPREYHQEALLV